jgi:hypothetical protein
MQGGAMMEVRRKLENCQSRLQGWNRRKYRDVEKKVKKKTLLLTKLQQEENVGNKEKIQQL